MQQRFNFSHFYKNESLSDCTLLIRNDGDVKQRLPGHGIVLANVSHVFRAEVEQQQRLGGTPSIHLDVLPDQVPAACALVRYVYTGELPEPSPSQQTLLVHMLHLANTFGVTDCRTACCKALLQCHSLQPAASGLAFLLLSPLNAATPAAAAAGPSSAEDARTAGFSPLLQHCLDQLLQQLGDMEAVLGCPARLAQLHELPFPALLALLCDDRTCSASENTVLAAAHSWMAAAAQRDVRVDAAQREQLVAAVRVPLLEPCFLGTVVPRMAWLLEMLGPQGLAMAAGVARGLCDPHAEPVLGCERACGALAAGWLQGPRPVPASCGRAMHGGPALTLHWDLALSDVKAAFEAACAEAAAKALARQQQRQAAAAAAVQQAALVSSDAPGWGLSFRSPMASASAVAAMNAVASVAAAAAARVLSKRKRSCSVTQSVDEGGRDQQSSSTAAVGMDRAGLQPVQQQDGEGAAEGDAGVQGVQHAGDEQGGAEDAAAAPEQTPRKRRRRTAGPPADIAGDAGPSAAGGAGRAPAPSPRPSTSQAARDVQPLSPPAGPAGTASAFFSQEPAAAAPAPAPAPPVPPSPRVDTTSLSTGAQHLPRQFKLRSQEAQFCGYTWRLVLYFQPRQATAGAAGAAGEAEDAPAAGTCTGGASGGAHLAVAAVHAVQLPDEAGPSAAAAGTSCLWTARLAIEAWPAVALPGGSSSSSTVAFSGNLAVRLTEDTPDVAAAAAGSSRRRPQAGGSQRNGRSRAAAAASPAGDRALGTRGGSQGAAPSPGRRLVRTDGKSPARYLTQPEAAAAAGGGVRQRGGRQSSPAGRQLEAAGDGEEDRGVQGHPGLLSIPESDAGEGSEDDASDSSQSEESGDQPSSSEEEEEEEGGNGRRRRAAVQDSDDDEGFTIVGEYAAGTPAAARVASTPRGSGRGRQAAQQQRQQQQPRGRRAGRPASAGAEGDPEGALHAATPGGASVGAAGVAEDDRLWRVLQLPQGSWLKSRRCDTGFTSFFSITLQQGVWDEEAWAPYLQAGGILRLRGNIWNVR